MTNKQNIPQRKSLKNSWKNRCEDQWALLKSMKTNFTETGSIMPSSRYLSKALVEIIPLKRAKIGEKRGLRILEAGAGTGPVTKKILDNLKPEDHFTICEINPQLIKVLKKNIAQHPNYNLYKENIKIFAGPVQEIQAEDFDVIICGIPFLNLPANLTQEIFEAFHRLLGEEGILSYFSYLGGREVGYLFPKKLRERRVQLMGFFKQQNYFELFFKKRVWFNLMPAVVKYMARK